MEPGHVILIPAVLGLAIKLGDAGRVVGVGLHGQGQMPHVRPDRELLGVHPHASVIPELGPLPANQGEQVMPMQAIDRRQAERGKRRGEDVHRLHERLVPHPAMFTPGHPDNQGGVDEFLIEPGTEAANVAVLAKGLPLVAGEDDQGIVQTS